MLALVIKRLLSNGWMVLCLLLGSVLAIAMISSVPIYTNGVLQRMLIKDLENYQISSNTFPGNYILKIAVEIDQDNKEPLQALPAIDDYMADRLPGQIKLPLLASARNFELHYLAGLPDLGWRKSTFIEDLRISAIPDLENHIDIVEGRIYDDDASEGFYEAIVTNRLLNEMDLRIGDSIKVVDSRSVDTEICDVKIVGSFRPADYSHQFWFRDFGDYRNSLFIRYPLFNGMLSGENTAGLLKGQWYLAFDYHKLTMKSSADLLTVYGSHSRWMSSYSFFWDVDAEAASTILSYNQREARLRAILWVLQAPLLLMLLFFVFMAMNIIVESRKNEIALMRSRGMKGIQLLQSYLIESAILAFLALLLGPPLGLLLCSFLGASNGFLQFVQRSALQLNLTLKAYFYSFIGALGLVLTMLIPALKAQGTTIVLYKRTSSRNKRKLNWQRMFLDIILLAVSGYGLYSYWIRQETLEVTGASGTDIAIDPLLYIISTLFMIGAGLFILRIFPLLVRLVFVAGRKLWNPALYAAFTQVERKTVGKNYFMIFLMLALAIGIYSANSARTINHNAEEKRRYFVGADIALQATWEKDYITVNPGAESAQQPPGVTSGALPFVYNEPPFPPFAQLDGIEKATKVYVNDRIRIGSRMGGTVADETQLMAVVPDEFGMTAWFREDLLPFHWWQYLNLLARAPDAVLVSTSLKQKLGLQLGDTILISWRWQNPIQCRVFGFIDYWPTYNPAHAAGKAEPALVVANLSYIQAHSPVEPYEVWLKKKANASSEQIYEDIKRKGLRLDWLRDAGQQIINVKNDPLLQGLNGGMTLGFIITMIICILGFLFYWIMNIQQRSLQFGLFRAMGLSRSAVVGTIFAEQIMLSLFSVIGGIAIGGFASYLFIPLLQVAYSAAEQVPPFKVIFERGDYARVYAIAACMLLFCTAVLVYIVSRIKVTEALKLGEE